MNKEEFLNSVKYILSEASIEDQIKKYASKVYSSGALPLKGVSPDDFSWAKLVIYVALDETKYNLRPLSHKNEIKNLNKTV